jgi:hypothetical protein
MLLKIFVKNQHVLRVKVSNLLVEKKIKQKLRRSSISIRIQS